MTAKLLQQEAARPARRRPGHDHAIVREAATQQAALGRCIDAYHDWPALPAGQAFIPVRALRDAHLRSASLRTDARAIVGAFDALAHQLETLGRATLTPDGIVVHFEPDPGTAALARQVLAALEHARARTRQAALHLMRTLQPEDGTGDGDRAGEGRGAGAAGIARLLPKADDAAGPAPVMPGAPPAEASDAGSRAHAAQAHASPGDRRPERPQRSAASRGIPRRVHLEAAAEPVELTIAEARVLTGPNLHAAGPVVAARLSTDLPMRPGAVDLVAAAFPELGEEGLPAAPAALAARIAVALQRRAGLDVPLGAWSSDGATLAFGFQEPDAGLEAADGAARALRDAARGDPIDFADDVEAIRHAARRSALGPTTAGIVAEARRRDVPVLRLDDDSYLQLGHGARQQRVQASMAGTTSGIGMEIADDKARTKRVLQDAGIRVPHGETVDDPDDAVAAAESLGYPVVVKPLVGNHGRGVSTDLRDEAQVRAAYDLAAAVHPRVVVEHHIEGRDFRVLVVGGKLVAAARRDPAHVVGDGRSTIRELVEETNRDPRRGDGHEAALSRIVIDEATLQLLERTGRTPDSVPRDGERVDLKGTANLSTGGTATDVTDLVHPDVRRACERAARFVGLDIMGLDIVAKHLEAPLEETRGAVVEVNAAPGLRMHLHPSHGKPRDAAGAIVEMLFPPGASSRIPIVAVTGTNGKTTTTRLIAHILGQSGLRVGLATTSGVEVDGGYAKRGDYAGPDGALAVLKDPLVEAAVLEVARGGILRRGLGFDRCDVGVLLNVASDHLGDAGVGTVEDLARVKGVVLRAAAPDGHAVANAEDPLVVQAWRASGATGILFGLEPSGAVLQEHVRSGGLAVSVVEGSIAFLSKAGARPIVPLHAVPVTFGGRVRFNVANALAAAASAFAAGAPVAAIAAGLRTFQPDPAHSPGRMNLLRCGDVQVLVDYGHNPAALRALGEALTTFPAKRRIGVASASGNRRTADIEDFGRELGRLYDHVIVTDPDPRGRAPGETMRMVAQAARGAGHLMVEEVASEAAAFHRALDVARPGDLVVLHADDVRGALTLIANASPVAPATPSGAGPNAGTSPSGAAGTPDGDREAPAAARLVAQATPRHPAAA